ncbi:MULTISPECIES: hypothetical protein [Pseudomonas]|uniref:hypothetical protein n=1 Tax=Pseudomonas TaxID=286 RepID=UPI0024B72FF8|nr:hypothetical protein [Pseudomonas helmanticensis]
MSLFENAWRAYAILTAQPFPVKHNPVGAAAGCDLLISERGASPGSIPTPSVGTISQKITACGSA